MASIFLDRHEDMSIEHCNLTKLFEFRLLRPNECYFIISTIVGAVAYLHQKGYTLEENLRSDSVVVLIDSQVNNLFFFNFATSKLLFSIIYWPKIDSYKQKH